MSGRRAVHAYLSNRAHDQWHEFAATQGVSVSAMLEALAPILHEANDEEFASVVSTARRIDANRRRRSTSTAG